MGVIVLLSILSTTISICLFMGYAFGAEWGWFTAFFISIAISVAVGLEYRRNYGNGE